MISLELTHAELRLMQNALNALLSNFGHKQHDVVREVRDLLTKITPAE